MANELSNMFRGFLKDVGTLVAVPFLLAGLKLLERDPQLSGVMALIGIASAMTAWISYKSGWSRGRKETHGE